LFDSEKCGGESSDAAFFEDFAGSETFPGTGDFDANAGSVEGEVKVPEELENALFLVSQ
jgi:hypothetical protein